MNMDYGARIERGRIAEIQEGEETLYIVQSLTRDGILTLPIPALKISREAHIIAGDGSIQNEYETYAVGDCVYFFLFGDGQGMILAAFQVEAK